MTILDATKVVLQQAGEPLHYREITKRSLEQGLWHTTGKTPADTVSACIVEYMKKFGDQAQLMRTAPGTYTRR